MHRTPPPDPFPSRAALPEGCSDLLDAYRIRSATRERRARFLLRLAAMMHDPLVSTIDPEILRTRNPDHLLHRISDFLHPMLIANPHLEETVRPSSELVETLFHVMMANLDEDTRGSC
jgi:hypothetical protein